MGLIIGTDLGIGSGFFLSDRSIDRNHIIIEDRVDISANVSFIASSGPKFSKWKHIYKVKSEIIVIKHDVWIGHGAIILPGVTVGEFSIIGAGTMVDRNIPAYSSAIGNPMIIKAIPSALLAKLKQFQN